MNSVNRIGIFIFYDKDGIVDDYVIYLLEDIKKVLSKLVIISNTELSGDEYDKLNNISDELIIRKNIGLDAAAFCEYYNNHDLHEYDEMVVFNDTFYGPFRSFELVFDDMKNKDKLDFWGLSKGYKSFNYVTQSEIPEHIQTFFAVYKNNVFTSDIFKNYWKNYNINKMNTFNDVVNNHEILFTKYLNDNGFNYDVYCNDTYYNNRINHNHYAYSSYDQIANNNGLFLKKKNMSFNIKDYNYLSDVPDLKLSLDFINKNLDYDINMIWRNALRLYPLTDLAYSCGFEKVIQDCTVDKDYSNQTTVLIIINNPKYINEAINKTLFFKNRIYVGLNNQVCEELSNLNVENVCISNDIINLINIIKNIKTDYMMIINTSINNEMDVIDYSKQMNCYDNLIQSKDYYNSVMTLFNDDFIGSIYSPEQVNYDYFYLNLFWEPKLLEECKRILVDYKPGIDYNHPPVTLSQSLICRTSIINSIDFTKMNDYSFDMFIKVLCVCIQYYGAMSGMIPQIAYCPKYIEYRTNTYKYIYKNVYRSLYENNYFPATLIESTKAINDNANTIKVGLFVRIKNRIKIIIKKIVGKK